MDFSSLNWEDTHAPERHKDLEHVVKKSNDFSVDNKFKE